TGQARGRRFPTSAMRKRVLMWMESAPSRAQAKIAARYPAPFGSHSATRAPGPTPALRRPAATHNTRFWKARRSSVPAESVTAGPDGSSSDHAISAPSVCGYSGPYVFRIEPIPLTSDRLSEPLILIGFQPTAWLVTQACLGWGFLPLRRALQGGVHRSN